MCGGAVSVGGSLRGLSCCYCCHQVFFPYKEVGRLMPPPLGLEKLYLQVLDIRAVEILRCCLGCVVIVLEEAFR